MYINEKKYIEYDKLKITPKILSMKFLFLFLAFFIFSSQTKPISKRFASTSVSRKGSPYKISDIGDLLRKFFIGGIGYTMVKSQLRPTLTVNIYFSGEVREVEIWITKHIVV